ncbi:hypothetical protein BKA93DRAFT_816904 [Sparassis latifolia]
MHTHRDVKDLKVSGCNRWFKNKGGLTKHTRSTHAHAPPAQRQTNTIYQAQYATSSHGNAYDDQEAETDSEDESSDTQEYHPYINGRPCDENGIYLPNGTPPPPSPAPEPDDWFPYPDRIDTLLQLCAASLVQHQDHPPFADHEELYSTIDSTLLGEVRWESFNLQYEGELPERNVPSWMTAKYEVHFRNPREVFRNQMGNVDFDGEIDYGPLWEFENGKHCLKDFMSGNWAWRQADLIAQDPSTHGAAFIPVILGSDKTTVSVATGQNEYYPLYGSIGGVHNNVRRAHRNAVALLGFLAIPKTDKEFSEDAMFRKFRRQLFHSSLSRILQPLKPGMTMPEVTLCADGHYRRVMYGLSPYIADYPEQALLACVVSGWCPKCTASRNDLDGPGYGLRCREHTELLVRELELDIPFTNDFPRADIHELLSPDLLHQIIKGTFKDHLVSWVEDYIHLTYDKKEVKRIMADIDQRIAAVPAFSGLRRFPEGCGFKQWTGDDSKALMKVYLPAIIDYIPQDMVRAIRAFLEFCYLARCNTSGVRPDGISLPRQHSLCHYKFSIWEFGAPNGLCSSITESKHIKAALGQMLWTNQRIDKLAAACVDFTNRGMLNGSCLSEALRKLDDSLSEKEDVEANADHLTIKPSNCDKQNDDGAVSGPTILAYVDLAATIQRQHARSFAELAKEINQLKLPELIRQFLYDQLNPDNPRPASDIDINECPTLKGKISVHYSAAATYYAPSDPCGVSGMHLWRGLAPHFDCALDGMLGIEVVRIHLFFSFKHEGHQYSCALVHWFQRIDDQPNEDPEMDVQHIPFMSIIHLDSIICAAHLILVYGDARISRDITDENSLDAFQAFYVNKFADHHAFEILS